MNCMDFYEILREIMLEKGLNVSDVARICGLRDSTVRSIVIRKQKNVALEVAFKLSDGLGVSLERLNGMPEPETNAKPAAPDPSISDITPHEIDMIRAYRKSDEETRLIVDLALKPNYPDGTEIPHPAIFSNKQKKRQRRKD